MTSPFRRHQMQARAVAAGGPAARPATLPPVPSDGPAGDEYRLLLVALGEDLRALSDIQSIERKVAAKRQMIAKYRPWIDGVLDAGARGQAAQDEIVTTMLVWSVDIGDIPLALALAQHVLAFGLQLPERYNRTPATLIAEEIAEAALADPAAVTRDQLVRTAALTDPFDMADQARAKLAKALGRAFAAEADAFDPEAADAVAGGRAALFDAALAHLRRALTLNEAIGVKTEIRRIERAREQLAAAPTPEATPGATPADLVPAPDPAPAGAVLGEVVLPGAPIVPAAADVAALEYPALPDGGAPATPADPVPANDR